MPNIRDLGLYVGRTSFSDEEFARVSFNVDFDADDQNCENGFLMHIILIDVNEGLDEFSAGPLGIIHLGYSGDPDRLVGEVYRDIVHPPGPTMHVDRSHAWDFGELDEGPEEFKALVAVIPKNGKNAPVLAQSNSVKIDLG